MNSMDVLFALIDTLALGKLEMELLGGGNDQAYYVAIKNYAGDIMFDATERRLGDAIISVRDQVVSDFLHSSPSGESNE